jgi:hypothetical protein
VTYAGLTLRKPPTWEYALSKLIGGTMWCVGLTPRNRSQQLGGHNLSLRLQLIQYVSWQLL